MEDENKKSAIDYGHVNLIKDLKWLLEMAKNKEYHDFANTNYATPKVQLRQHLLEVAQNVVDGRYDNK